jgi:hypothetical protein
MATVQNIALTHRAGMTYITADVNGLSGPFNVRRHTSAFSSASDGSAVCQVLATSWKLLHDDSASAVDLNDGLVIEDEGAQLTSAKILAVVAGQASATAHYAIFEQGGDTTVNSGENTTSVAETLTAEEARDCVLVNSYTPTSGYTTHQFILFEDYRTWNTAEWGAPVHRFNVTIQNGSAAPRPVVMRLEGGGSAGYALPIDVDPGYGNVGLIGVYPVDYGFQAGGGTDPYTGDTHEKTYWFGHPPSGGTMHNTAERRLYRILTHVLARDFDADPERVYIYGASGGGMGAMHMLLRYPTFFAAGLANTPGLTTQGLAYVQGAIAGGTTVNGTATAVEDFYDADALAAQGAVLPTILHGFDTQDSAWGSGLVEDETVPLLAAMRAAKRPYIATWDDPGAHTAPDLGSSGRNFFGTFTRNEARVAFYDASDDDDYETNPGQRGTALTYGRALHPLSGSQIVDQPALLTVPLQSYGEDKTSKVCVWNTQAFTPAAGSSVDWRVRDGLTGGGSILGSGQSVVGSLGQIVISALINITASGVQLEVTPPAQRAMLLIRAS